MFRACRHLCCSDILQLHRAFYEPAILSAVWAATERRREIVHEQSDNESIQRFPQNFTNTKLYFFIRNYTRISFLILSYRHFSIWFFHWNPWKLWKHIWIIIMSLQNLIQVYTTTVHLFDRLCPEEKFWDFINQFNLSILKTHDVKRLHTKFCKIALRVHRKMCCMNSSDFHLFIIYWLEC